jgi:hypothetical protein
MDVTERLYKRLKTQNAKPKTQNCFSIDPNSRHSIVIFRVGRKAINILSDKLYDSFNRDEGTGFRS